MGDLRSGNELIIILDIAIPEFKTKEEKRNIVNFKIKWIPRGGSVIPIESKISCWITYTMDERLLSQENEDVLENVHLLETASVQYEAMEMADRGDFSGAQRVMKSMQSKLSAQVSKSGSIQLKQLHEQNTRMMDEVLREERYDKGTRKELRSSMYELRKRR
jgi:hypothetical protein